MQQHKVDWLGLDKDTVFNGRDADGNRYLSQFLADYERIFTPVDINAGCKRCLDGYYIKLIKHLKMGNTTEPKEYQLKIKYNGIPLAFGSQIFVTNANITKEYAEILLKTHPRGADLFDVFTEIEEADPLKGLKRAELEEIATEKGLNPENYSNITLLKAAITEKTD